MNDQAPADNHGLFGRHERWHASTRPTHRLRMRAMCNEVKAKLLGDQHDPWSDQADLVFADPEHAPAGDPRTWVAWWSGQREQTRSDGLRRFNQIVTGASQWVEQSHLGSAMQRSFDALDVVADVRLSKTAPEELAWERAVEVKLALLEKCLASCNRAWSVLTSPTPLSGNVEEQAKVLMARNCPGQQLPPASMALATQEDRLREAIGTVNPYSLDLPVSLRRVHSASDKFSLLRLLVLAGAELHDTEPWWICPWAVELATIAALAHSYANFGPKESPSENLGDECLLVAVVYRMLFDHDTGTVTPILSYMPALADELRIAEAPLRQALIRARRSYHFQLRSVGISFPEIYRLAQPVQVMNEPSIEGQVLLICPPLRLSAS